mmetsp:Transcript_31433/g.58645  ORF Transcript_31433/g.58645 Transcript_31433/m.58645 type:complete len:164 (-) Transcript_31433:434-925(-)
MDLWDLKISRRISWGPEVESIFAVFCRKYAFDFQKVAAAMRKYVSSHLSNDPRARLVDPYMFTADVCRVHWSYRDYAKRKSRERVDGSAPSEVYEKPSNIDEKPSGTLDEKVVTKPIETVESKDGLTLVVSQVIEKQTEESDSDDAMAKLDQLVSAKEARRAA